METPINKENLAFSKSAIRMGFDALSAFTSQAAMASDMLLGAAPAIPEEGKKAVSLFFREGQKGLESLKNHVERSLEVDWTSKDAPVKNLETMESLCKDAFSQVDEIKNETRTLMDQATKSLPKETKYFVDSWNESVNNSLEFFESYVNRNFELARRALNTAAAATPNFEQPQQHPLGEENP